MSNGLHHENLALLCIHLHHGNKFVEHEISLNLDIIAESEYKEYRLGSWEGICGQKKKLGTIKE